MVALMEKQQPDVIMINGEEVQPVLIHEAPAITLQQAATYLGISATALNRRLNRKGIKRYQRGVGRERYVLFEDVERLASFHEVSDASDPE